MLMELEFSQRIIEKYSNINFHENLSVGRQVLRCAIPVVCLYNKVR